MDPAQSADDFPYPFYPYHLPHYPLSVVERHESTWQTFAEPLPNVRTELDCDLFVVIPPPETIGCSLWGRTGDGEGVLMRDDGHFGTGKFLSSGYRGGSITVTDFTGDGTAQT